MSSSVRHVDDGAGSAVKLEQEQPGTPAGTAGPTPVDELTERIRNAILAGEFASHQRLIEADLSARYDATRAAVRSALLTLTGEGLVERQPNRGARVRAITVREAVEIAEVRVGLESLCARKAAEHATDDDVAGLLELRAAIADAVAAGRLLEYGELNRELDRRLRRMSGHDTATQLLERLLAQSARHQFRLAFHPGRAAVSALEHIAIIDAVIAREPDSAEAATRTHLQGVIEALASQREH
ncbi:GntR family transcriptional regulator [Pseudoclavibacter endophyticus]|uniref:GntR family transcriptional regulator n=1 Tax=Pseudoclavibacter endophyticus TaxID=1778590 RepID=A0A6H9WGD4_9MICO|nr:GntR family transcriptional regulator [Pseudoclavibacter endophyticus]KAB1648074.1 GntR family transcriptional regulator [Pseudoclavibacter endophyticus]GGA69478.1 GntR family transcriptional regulator [Pseudoclavibacter endophyticus]